MNQAKAFTEKICKVKDCSNSGEYCRKAHPLYATYKHMRNRCYNVKPDHPDYTYWRGRGIKICDRWMDIENGFWSFVTDMGSKPDGKYSIDRINVDGDYTPDNCRWATDTEQSRNRRNVK